MKREDVEKLLGGYAAGTLTAEEREALFGAALEDQELFEALAREEPLRELLEDPAARSHLLAGLGTAREPWYYRPIGLTPILATAAAAIIVAAVVYWWPARRQGPVQVAQVLPQDAITPSQKPFVSPPRPRAARPVLPTALPPVLPAPVYAPLPRVLAEVKLPPPQPIAQSASVRLPTAMQFRAEQQAVAALPAPFGLRYSIVKTLPGGELTELDAKQELDRDDEVQIRFQANEAGYLYVLQRDSEKNWQPFASQRIQPAMPVVLPPKGSLLAASGESKELFVVFSRQPQTSLNRVRSIAVSYRGPEQQQVSSIGGFGGARAVITTVPEPAAQQVAFPITLKYK
jgi:hypothetical protein